MISAGIDKVLGKGNSPIFLTLKLVYNFDQSSVPLELGKFETLVRKVIGEKAAKIVLNEIIKEIKSFKMINDSSA